MDLTLLLITTRLESIKNFEVLDGNHYASFRKACLLGVSRVDLLLISEVPVEGGRDKSDPPRLHRKSDYAYPGGS